MVLIGGRVVLIRRGKEPLRGRWVIPGGTVELGETLQEALVREMREETGLVVRPREQELMQAGAVSRLRAPTATHPRTFAVRFSHRKSRDFLDGATMDATGMNEQLCTAITRRSSPRAPRAAQPRPFGFFTSPWHLKQCARKIGFTSAS